MSGHGRQQFTPAPCPRCTGYGDAHYLTCPTLRLRISPAADRAWREMVALGQEIALSEEVMPHAAGQHDRCSDTHHLYETQAGLIPARPP